MLVLKASQLGFTFEPRLPFKETEHPRVPAGLPHGGEFAPKPQAPAPPSDPRPRAAKTLNDVGAKDYELLEGGYVTKHWKDARYAASEWYNKLVRVHNREKDQAKRAKHKLDLQARREILERVKVAMVHEKDGTTALPEQEAAVRHVLHWKYLNLVKEAISRGDPVPYDVIDQKPEFRLALTARQRYEKGRHTSFANVSAAIDATMQAARGFKAKRQDGLPMTHGVREDLLKGVTEVEDVLGPLAELMRAADLTISHTVGKQPFMSARASGLYSPGEKTVSTGMALAPSLAHELGHWMDFDAGEKLGRSTRVGNPSATQFFATSSLAEAERSDLIREARDLMNDSRAVEVLLHEDSSKTKDPERKKVIQRTKVMLGPYWNQAREIWARLTEQYVAYRRNAGGWSHDSPTYYESAPGWWTREDFEHVMPQLEGEIVKRLEGMGGEAASAAFKAKLAAWGPLTPTAPPREFEYEGKRYFVRRGKFQLTRDKWAAVDAETGKIAGHWAETPEAAEAAFRDLQAKGAAEHARSDRRSAAFDRIKAGAVTDEDWATIQAPTGREWLASDLVRSLHERFGMKLDDAKALVSKHERVSSSGHVVAEAQQVFHRAAAKHYFTKLEAAHKAAVAAVAPHVEEFKRTRRPVEFERRVSEGSKPSVAVLSRDASDQGKHRITVFDENGPSYHTSHDTAEQAIEEHVRDLTGNVVPGTIDRWSQTPHWAAGMEHIARVREINQRTSPPPGPLSPGVAIEPRGEGHSITIRDAGGGIVTTAWKSGDRAAAEAEARDLFERHLRGETGPRLGEFASGRRPRGSRRSFSEILQGTIDRMNKAVAAPIRWMLKATQLGFVFERQHPRVPAGLPHGGEFIEKPHVARTPEPEKEPPRTTAIGVSGHGKVKQLEDRGFRFVRIDDPAAIPQKLVEGSLWPVGHKLRAAGVWVAAIPAHLREKIAESRAQFADIAEWASRPPEERVVNTGYSDQPWRVRIGPESAPYFSLGYGTKRDALGDLDRVAAMMLESAAERAREHASWLGESIEFQDPAAALAAAKAKLERQTAADPKLAAKLRRAADALTPIIESKLNPAIGQQNVTMRRAGIAAGMTQEARHFEKVQRVLRTIATMADKGEVPEALTGVTTRAAVEQLLYGRGAFPSAYVYAGNVKSLLDVLPDMPEGSYNGMDALILSGAWDRGVNAERAGGAAATNLTQAEVDAAARLIAAMKVARPVNKYGHQHYLGGVIDDQVADYRRARAMGLDTEEKWNAAVALVRHLGGEHVETPEEKVRKLEHEILGRTYAGYFPTPKLAAEEAAHRANIQPGMTVLEPSAGKGDMADAIVRVQPEAKVKGIEIQHALADIARARGHDVDTGNIFSHEGRYDRVVMNPPFEEGAEMDHVRRAYKHHLKPGGRLVSIMSEGPFFRNDRKAVEFRDWLDRVGGEAEPMPEGSFARHQSSDRTTGVRTRMVVIDKPAEAPPDVLKAMLSRKAQLEKDLFYLEDEDLPALDGRDDNEGVMMKAGLVTLRNEMFGELLAVDEMLKAKRVVVHPGERGGKGRWNEKGEFVYDSKHRQDVAAIRRDMAAGASELRPVVARVPEDWKRLGLAELQDAAREKIREYSASNQRTRQPYKAIGWIRFSKRKSTKAVSASGGGGNRSKLLMVPDLRRLLARSVYHNTEPGEPKTHHLYGKVAVGRDLFNVSFVLREAPDGSFYYNHHEIRVAPAENETGASSPSVADSPREGNLPSTVNESPVRKSNLTFLDWFFKSRRLHGRRWVDGLHMSIENRRGSVRHWENHETGEDGRTKVQHPYGYVRRTLSVDGDHHDVFLGPLARSGQVEDTDVYVITTMKPPEFAEIDEQKHMVGFASLEDAKASFLAHYDDPRFMGQIDAVPWGEYKREVRATAHGGGLVRGDVVERQPMAKGRLLLFTKAHVREYERHGASGAPVRVHEHEDKRQAAQQAAGTPRPAAAPKFTMRSPTPGRVALPMGPPKAATSPASAAAAMTQPVETEKPPTAGDAIDHDELGRYIESFRPPLVKTIARLSSLFPDVPVGGRLKETGSLAEKLVRKEKGLGDIEDIGGSRVELDNCADILAAVDRIKRSFRVRSEDDYINNPKGGVYRSYHLIIEHEGGKPIEVQVRTPRQTAIADAMHDITYKAHGSAPPAEAMPYFKQVADYFGCKDGAPGIAQPDCGQMPECPPPVAQVHGCVKEPQATMMKASVNGDGVAGLREFLGIRDHESGRTIALRPLGKEHDRAKVFAESRKKFPPPRFEVLIGVAKDLKTFVRLYPRFADGLEQEQGEEKEDANG